MAVLFNILVADSDERLGKVFHKTLEDVGFSNVTLAGNGQRALEALQKKSYDLLITEWNLQKMNGMELINSVRRGPGSSDPTLPIIMLTGRAEQNDVLAARDAGVNEYVIKPFSAKTIYSRLERLIENPRHFIVSFTYVGPDRRGSHKMAEGFPDQRKACVKPQMKPRSPEIRLNDSPKIWVVDYALTRKLGKGNVLSTLITPEALKFAQAAIDSITVESLVWIRDNLAQLKNHLERLKASSDTAPIMVKISEEALNLSGRAGTFNYTNASKISYLLYLFCASQPLIEKTILSLVIEKHIHVLQVTLSPTPSKINVQEIGQIIHELEKLAKKFIVQAA